MAGLTPDVPDALTEEYRQDMWKQMLQSDMEFRYWTCELRRLKKIDLWIRIVLLCTASGGAIGSWGLWKTVPWAWQALSGAAAIAAIVQTAAAYTGQIECLTRVIVEMHMLSTEFRTLWNDRNTAARSELVAKYKALQARESALVKDVSGFRIDTKTVEDCQRAVFADHGIPFPETTGMRRKEIRSDA